MKSLFELYLEHKGKVSDKWSIYLSEYDRVFSLYRDRPIRLLEIGVQNGGSLEVWSKYFTYAQTLVGCDINPDCAKLNYKDSRIKVVIGDVCTDATEAEILSHSPLYDIIIDDGSHTSSDIVKSFSRYFCSLNDGGIFVVEDLHCSYWKNFEGGLYYPYSSMAFFKRLADVVNHEHWGVEVEIKQLLRGFSEHFSAEFDDAYLAEIHSVEFVNSVCIVHKRKQQSNVLGKRHVAGQREQVVSGHHQLSSYFSKTPSQLDNPWSTMTPAPEEDWEKQSKTVSEREGQIANLNRSVIERDGQIALFSQEIFELRNSTSWRVTKPIRFIGHQLARGKRFVKVVQTTVDMVGGPCATIRKVLNLYRREGMAGLVRGVRVLQTGGGCQACSRFR